ncbi:multicopper oxidase family protein [Streptomyces palmae]|uniref:Multicopper oxidase family protein n=1 Tax=Streptomyces palmae TaxID=1701085 RepID=A0A4Z0HE48_9ACTN|nr:multicopper oxidase family protein [Streptomyces palmae]TGB16604.1 multicopper oxidase family protein [Streptomyces palmae]
MPTPSRRAVLGAGIAVSGAGLLSACSFRSSGATVDDADHRARPAAGHAARYVDPYGPEVRAAERRRTRGAIRTMRLTAAPTELDLGGRIVRTWAYENRLPGQEVRLTAGDTLALTLANRLPQSTTVHWHGVALRNDMDGSPGITQDPIPVGGSFDYRFAIAHPGTYWFHSHSGVQLDRGLYAPLIVEDPREPLNYDHEWVVVLDDWLDGVQGSTPDEVLEELAGGRIMGHGDTPAGGTHRPTAGTHPATGGGRHRHGPSRMLRYGYSPLLESQAGHIAYPYYLVNGRTAKDPQTFRAKPGDRVRIRFINASSDTPFLVALGGHAMTITHTDGYPVEQRTADALLLGMGERYDVLVTAKSGAFPLTAVAEGKRKAAMAVLRTDKSAPPSPSARPAELHGRLVTADQLLAAEPARLAPRPPDRVLRMVLTGSMAGWNWTINHEPYDPRRRYPVRAGERVRLKFVNRTRMWHPMHLHGHTGSLAGYGFLRGTRPAAGTGARKDTTIVLPRSWVELDFDADNPGLWMLHCHNVYHQETGMMTVLGYRK